MAELAAVEGDWGGPYVAAATFCEAVILEQGSGVPTLVRLAQRASANIESAESSSVELPGIGVELTLFLLLRAGNAPDEGRLSFDLIRPDGEIQQGVIEQEITWPQPATDETRAETNLRIVNHIRVGPEYEGMICMDVRYDGRLLTRVPIRLSFRSTPTP